MSYNEENSKETARLRAVCERLDDAAWKKDLGGGWTIGTMICHLAFWDQMTIERLQKWIRKGTLVQPPDADNVEVINESLRAVSAGVARKEGIEIALRAADMMDEVVRSLSAEQTSELEKSGRDRWFKRSVHRQLHLPRIEAGLK